MSLTATAPADLKARIAARIVTRLDEVDDLRTATVDVANEVHAEALSKGWTAAQARLVGTLAAEIGADLYAAALEAAQAAVARRRA